MPLFVPDAVKTPIGLILMACCLWVQSALAVPGKTVPTIKPTAKPPPAARALPKKRAVPAKLAVPSARPIAAAVTPDDARQLVRMPSPARLAMREEMRGRMSALDEVMRLLAAGKVNDAGEVARLQLGVALWGNHRKLDKVAQPEQYLPEEMRTLALDSYKAASDFATVALTGDRETAQALLPQLTAGCAQCHQRYRIR